MKRILFINFVCVFVLSSPAFAAIVYSGSQITVTPGDSVPISIAGSGDSWDDFTVEMGLSLTMTMGGPAMMGFVGTNLAIHGASMGSTVGDPLSPYVTNLLPGTLIGMGSSWSDNWVLTEGIDDPPGVGTWTGGNFGPDGGYIGLQMFGPGGSYFGWLHLASQTEIGVPLFSHTAIFDGWAYEDQPGVPIGAGVIPAPGALLMVGLGTGITAWLRRRKVV